MIEQVFVTIEEAQALYTRGDAAHDFDHVLRVHALAMRIAAAEGADETVVGLSALLHDVPSTGDNSADNDPAGDVDEDSAQHQQMRRAAHHLCAAETAKHILAERGVGTERLRNIVHSIEAHRYRDQSIQPQTLEAQCLYDADKLDSIGAIGIGRAFAYAGAHGSRLWTEPAKQAPSVADQPHGADYTPVHEYVYKLRHIYDSLYTETARTIGQPRHEFMVKFYSQLDEEMAARR